MIDHLSKYFPLDGTSDFQVKEDLTEFALVVRLFNQEFNLNGIEDFISSFGEVEQFYFKYQIDGFNPIYLNTSDQSQIVSFQTLCEQERAQVEDECISLTLNIKKSTKSHIVRVFDEPKFFSFVNSLTLSSFLRILGDYLKRFERVQFVTYLQSNKRFSTDCISFNCSSSKTVLTKSNSTGLVHFSNQSEYPFLPSDFHINDSNELDSGNPLIKKLRLLELAFCIVRIFDLSTLTLSEDSIFITYRIQGYRTFEGEQINVEDIPMTSLDAYYKIFLWIYTEPTKSIDKIGLVRNVLTLFLKEGSLEINEDVFSSILSAYRTYLQQNLNRYIEVRGKIKDQLGLIVQKANSIAESHIGNFQRSLFLFISFFISVFVIRVIVTNKFDGVITNEAKILSFAILGLSVIYLIYSLILVKKEKDRLKVRYQNLKAGFEDLLLKEDIDRILNNDKEYKSEVEFIRTRVQMSTIVWIISLITIALGILAASGDLF